MGIPHAKDFCEGKHDAGVEMWVSNFDVFWGDVTKNIIENGMKNVIKNIKLCFSLYTV